MKIDHEKNSVEYLGQAVHHQSVVAAVSFYFRYTTCLCCDVYVILKGRMTRATFSRPAISRSVRVVFSFFITIVRAISQLWGQYMAFAHGVYCDCVSTRFCGHKTDSLPVSHAPPSPTAPESSLSPFSSWIRASRTRGRRGGQGLLATEMHLKLSKIITLVSAERQSRQSRSKPA